MNIDNFKHNIEKKASEESIIKCNDVTLVYHLWVPKTIQESYSFVYDLHLKNLKCYSSIFNHSIFVLACDDISDNERILKIERDILNCGYNKNVSFIVEENNSLLREAQTVKKHIIDSNIHGLVFFAHSKGITNFDTEKHFESKIDRDSIIEWICSMYYFNLSQFSNVFEMLSIRKCYGMFCKKGIPDCKYDWCYEGSFYWLNIDEVRNKAKEILCSNRCYAENLLGNLFEFDFATISSWRNIYFRYNKTLYEECDNILKTITIENDIKIFYEYQKMIISS